jgi:hypothetical protein
MAKDEPTHRRSRAASVLRMLGPLGCPTVDSVLADPDAK